MTAPIRFSHLKWMAESPAHYRHAVDTPWPSTAAQSLGTAVHRLMEGRPLPVYPGAVRRGKEWDAWRAEHGAESVTAEEDRTARAMVASIHCHPIASSLMLTGTMERRIDWTFAGRPASSTPDLYRVGSGGGIVVDLKTCRSAKPDVFLRDVRRYHYHAQLAFYREAIGQAENVAPDSLQAYIVAVESRAPYPVTVVRMTDRALRDGLASCYLWLERLRVCEAAGEWPGYSDHAPIDFDTADDEDVMLTFGEDGDE